MSVYGSSEPEQRLLEGFARAGNRLDMGKSCIHFKVTDDLPPDIIGELIASIPVDCWISIYEASRLRERKSESDL